MKFVSLRDFRARTADIRKDLAREHEIVLTANGRPVAILAQVDEESFEKRLEDLRLSRGRAALAGIREKARAKGVDNLSMEEIDAIVGKARREKRGRQ